jgi:ABC-type dipeptide/oligopeptide/nickel transport system permease subunit
MRLTELLLSIPSLYLIIALRAVFPMDLAQPSGVPRHRRESWRSSAGRVSRA